MLHRLSMGSGQVIRVIHGYYYNKAGVARIGSGSIEISSSFSGLNQPNVITVIGFFDPSRNLCRNFYLHVPCKEGAHPYPVRASARWFRLTGLDDDGEELLRAHVFAARETVAPYPLLRAEPVLVPRLGLHKSFHFSSFPQTRRCFLLLPFFSSFGW